ncbi:histidine--tRNA ligase [Breznakiella homolactica]|uniref:Histidine--tRNA ligase n=1 Tax=Breznakiella homolactica TaxID=2798577 RepID=A0A7T8BAA2_9SPIR|nr:histidine--tRNA ligase [Breznakiella homolactica]QQO08013.1 histidine--tRNA ligase [Breznakiella homolactica]
MADLIEPKILKGFRDFLPEAEIDRRSLVERIEASFRSYGFVPIDTPVLEYAEILLGKGGGETEKQIYRFNDHGGRDVALRFDLTVPFARFLAEHRNELALPFKRYHIAKVWRGENTQRGRYREFTQCDFDIVGSDSVAADFEILLMMRNTLQAIGVGDVRIHVNHRGIFNRFLQRIRGSDKSVDILRTVDKLAKIGREATLDLLSEILDAPRAGEILSFIEPRENFEETLKAMTEAAGGENADSERMRRIYGFMKDTGTADSFFLNPSITRGLDYYTGLVYETFLNDLPDIGSVCSGGRYDDLAGLYSKEKLSGVGSSIGLDRLISALESLGRLRKQKSYADIAVACVREEDGGGYQVLADRLRKAGFPCEVLLEPKKMVQQYVLAEKKGARWLIIPGDPLRENDLGLRDLRSRETRENISLDEITTILKKEE